MNKSDILLPGNLQVQRFKDEKDEKEEHTAPFFRVEYGES